MNEMMADGIITAAMYLSIILTGGCFSFLTKDYVKKQSYALWAGLAYAITMIVLKTVPCLLNNIAAYALGVLASTLVLCAFDRERMTVKLFLATTFYSIRWLVTSLEVSAVSLPFGSFVGYLNLKFNSATLAYVLFVIQVLLDLALEVLMMLGVIILLNRYFKYKNYDMSAKECLMLCIPSICAVFGYCVKIMYRDVFHMQTGQEIDFYLGVYTPVAYAYYICSILSILVVIILFQEFKLRQKEQMSRVVLEMQMDDMRRSIARVEKNYGEIRALRHDMGNHIQILKGMMSAGDRQGTNEYMTRLEEAYQSVSPRIKTGNPVTDIILGEKCMLAKEKGIRMDVDFHFPSDTNADAFDLGIILSNSVDNAMEAVDYDNPYISVYSKRRNHILLICVENSFAGCLTIDEETGLPKSKKKNENHGWGMVNMRNCAKKYYGDIDIEQQENRVIFCAMLSLK
ncbi:MAG: sensor histidine kinase [Lachnospiraceae bacterium]|nr:sensor histidine kinase [Lachnospiraceae bacterium]